MKVLIVCFLACLAHGAVFTVYPEERRARELPILQQRNAALLFGLDFPEEEERGAKAVDVEEEVYEVTEDDLRVEKSLLSTFPFNQQQDGHAQHGEHGAHHGAQHGVQHGAHHAAQPGAHDGQADQRRVPGTYTPGVQGPTSTDSASAPLRDRLSNRVREVVSQQVRQQLGQRPSTSQAFPFRGVAAAFREGEGDEEQEEDQNAVTFNVIGAAAGADEEVKGGRKCIDKVMMVEVTEYDDVITCDHSYDKRCHTSYVTNYDSQQEEECEENFKKVCYIEYEPLAYNETVQVCRTPIVKDCEVAGETVCQTVYETECSTEQKVHEVEDDVTTCRTEQMTKCRDVTVGYVTKPECEEWPVERCELERKLVKKYSPVTGCYKEPRELCAPRGCGFRNGTVECHDKVKTIVVDNPLETCEIQPEKTCRHVTKLVPRLVAKEECVDVPKEVCSRSKTNPRRVKKPVIKKWCYVPSDESGLE